MCKRSFLVAAVYFPTNWDSDVAVQGVYDLLSLLFATLDHHEDPVMIFGGGFNASIRAWRDGDTLFLVIEAPGFGMN